MDEPTVGIDPQSRNYILEAVKTLRDSGTTILYTTHYMEEVQSIASRVVIMDQGQIIKEGKVDELIQTVQHEEKVKIDVTDPERVPINSLEKIAGVKKVVVSGSQITITQQIRALQTGSTVLDADVLKTIMEPDKEAMEGLTKRESDIVELVAQGLSNKEIAEQLFLSVGTIRNTLSVILDKLEFRDRTQLAIYYWQRKQI